MGMNKARGLWNSNNEEGERKRVNLIYTVTKTNKCVLIQTMTSQYFSQLIDIYTALLYKTNTL